MYFFKKHNSVECNYEIYDKELMIIVRVFEEWHFELEDSSTLIEMITNHKNLEYFMSTKQLSHHQACWSEFLFQFNYHIIYCSEKVESKSDVLTRRSDDLSKKKNTQNSRHLHQHQTVLKSHVLDLRIQEDLQNLIFELRIIDLQCRIIALNSIQLHLVLLQSLSFIALVSMNLKFKELKLEVEDSESQLNQETLDSEEDSVDVLTQTLWNQVEDNDKFAFQILEALCKKVQYHSKILLAECENLDNFLYFRDRKYISNFNHLHLRIIQLAHDNVADEHSERAKCYDLVSRVYWWLNIYKYVQRFVQNYHVCIRFKSFRQRTQEWLRSLSVSQRRWRDVSMNYVDSLSLSIFMSVIYKYVLVFVDHLIKMKHLVLTVIMKVKEVINAYYAHVWKHHELLKFFLSDRDIQFIFNVWNHLCQMLKIDAKLFTAYHSQMND